MTTYTNEEMLESLYKLYIELKKSPTAAECNKCEYTAHTSTYRTRFGSWSSAKEKAGINAKSNKPSYTEYELLSALYRLYIESGKSPTTIECNNCAYTVTASTYVKRFGTWNRAKERAKIPTVVQGQRYTDEKLLSLLRKLEIELGRSPSTAECISCEYTPHPSTYIYRFGSFIKTKKLLGMPAIKAIYTDEDILKGIKDFYAKEGRGPRHIDFNQDNNLASVSTINIRLGSVQEACKLAGVEFDENKLSSTQRTDDELLDSLRRYYKEKGRAPRIEDCRHNRIPYMSCYSAYSNRFGTFLKAIDLAGIPRNLNGSIAEIELLEFVESLGVEVIANDRNILGNLELDIVVPSHKIAFEFDGLYWHSDERKDKKYHLNKTKAAEEAGYRLIHVFENEWADKQDIVKSRISSLLGKNNTVYARKCEIVNVTSQEHTKFMTDNHIQGNAFASIRLGLKFEDELVAVMSFCKSRFSKKYTWELLRYCNKLNTSVVGGASRLFKAAMKQLKEGNIVSYSDLRWNTGNLYNILGFEHTHNSDPNYWYFKGSKLESRVAYQKHKLKDKLENFNPDLTEYENMKLHGYNRIFDCGNAVFSYSIPKKNNT